MHLYIYTYIYIDIYIYTYVNISMPTFAGLDRAEKSSVHAGSHQKQKLSNQPTHSQTCNETPA